MVDNYKWYAVINGAELEQGDFIFNLEVPAIVEEGKDEVPMIMKRYDVIVMTQSCDIPKKVIDKIVVCPVYDIKDIATDYPQFEDDNYLEELRRGQDYKFHLLNKCELPEFKSDYKVVQFERPLTKEKNAILELLQSAGKHLRLLPPYREEMAQRFGLYFSRVAKPIDIPQFAE